MTVPFVDLRAQYEALRDEIDAGVRRVLESSSFVLGREVEAFEREFAEYVGARFCVGLNSGTAAVQLALQAAGVGPGDEVIVPANTFFATAEAVSTAGATPRFVDCDPASSNIDPSKIEAAITGRTRAVLPVHLYGQPADLDAVFAVARRHNLLVIEDAAQAHGAEYKGRRVGALGLAGCFSFYPGKNLGAYGEGGAAVSSDARMLQQMRLLRDWGSPRRYEHTLKGFNYRMDGIQGAILRVKMKYIDAWTEARRSRAAVYARHLSDAPVQLPRERAGCRHVYHVYAVRTRERQRMQAALQAQGIHTGVHYPIPVHLQPAHADLGYKRGDFPVSEQLADEVLSLPMFPELTDGQVEEICTVVRGVLQQA